MGGPRRGRVWLLAAASVLVASAAPSTAGPGAAAAPPTARVAFTLTTPYSTGNSWGATPVAMGVVGLDGSGRRTLAGVDPQSFSPHWSPDGRWITYSHLGHGFAEVQAVRSDGGPPLTVGQGVAASFSPDGRWLAWASADASRPGVLLLAVDPSDDRLVQPGAAPVLLPTLHRAWNPAWSPDASSLAVWVSRGTTDTPGDNDLFRLGLDGSEKQLSSGVQGDSEVSWRPDGREIAFTGWLPEKDVWRPQPYLVGADGSNQRVLVPDFLRRADFSGSVAWSPTGQELAVESPLYSDGALVITPDGRTVGRAGGDRFKGVRSPVFTPDGRSVVVAAYPEAGAAQSELFVAPDRGGPARQLSSSGGQVSGLGAVDPGRVLRVLGSTPGATAVSVGRQLRRSVAGGIVVVAPAEDELPATPLAAALGAALLPTGAALLDDETRAELQAHPPRTAYVVGRTTPAVEVELRLLGISDVRSLSALDAPSAAAAVASELHSAVAYVAPTTVGPEQLAAAAVAAGRRAPLLLTDQGALPAATKTAVQQGGVRQVVVVGGRDAVSDHVLDELRALGVSVQRVAGASAVAAHALAAGMSPRRTTVAAVGPASYGAALLAGSRRGLLLVDDATTVPFVARHARSIGYVDAVGSLALLPPGQEAALEGALARG